MATRAIAIYVDMASFVINELKQVGIEASLKQVETAQWHAMATRGDYQIGANLTGLGVDEPDANYYENYACGSPRNYSQYCSEEVMKMVDQQSQELNAQKRLLLLAGLQKQGRGGRGAAHPRLEARLLHVLAAREEPDPARQHLQLRPHGRRVAGQVSDPRAPGSTVKTYIAQRLGIGLLTLLGMSIVIFGMLRLAPGDIVDILFSTGGLREPGGAAGDREGARDSTGRCGCSTSSGCARS